MGDIWSFHKTQKYHGKKATAYDVQLNGASRKLIFCNDPEHQRVCTCQSCGLKIPREVPRIKLRASFYWGAGYYCMSCGLKLLNRKKRELRDYSKTLSEEVKEIEEIEKISKEVIENEFYEKKMALGRMLQVMSENKRK